MGVIAGLTLRECLSRRLVTIAGLATLLVIALTGAGDYRIATMHVQGLALPQAAQMLLAAQFEIIAMFMFSGVLGVGATFLASSAIANEVESGVAFTILARPLSRSAWVIGKWLGLSMLAVAYAIVTTVAEYILAWGLVGYRAPHPWAAMGFLSWEGITMVSLGLLLSTRLTATTGAIVGITGFFVAWMAGVVGGIGQALQNLTLIRVATVVKLIIPTDGLWRGAIASLESKALITLVGQRGVQAAANPFYVASPPPWPYLVWCGLWSLLVLWIAVQSMRLADL